MRMTPQRRAIVGALEAARRPLSPKEILEIARAETTKLSLPTVYRNLRALVDTGVAIAVEVLGQAPRYELTGLNHHHHFLCDGCNRLYDVPGCPGSFHHFAPIGFTVLDHELLLTGKCTSCT